MTTPRAILAVAVILTAFVMGVAPVVQDDFTSGPSGWGTGKGAEVKQEDGHSYLLQPGGKNTYATRSFAATGPKAAISFKVHTAKTLWLRTGFCDLYQTEAGKITLRTPEGAVTLALPGTLWRTLTLKPDYSARTYSIEIEGGETKQGLAFSSTCKETNLSRLTILGNGDKPSAIAAVRVSTGFADTPPGAATTSPQPAKTPANQEPVQASTAISQAEQDYGRYAGGGASNIPKAEARELNARRGIPNFVKRARAGEALNVAYFGGSITAHEGWRPQSFAGLEKLFPKAKLRMIPASVGGTGSIVGAFRADRDLVALAPDLVFIEFAVNDAGDAKNTPEKVMAAMEGIVRKLLAKNPLTEVVFVYSLQTPDVETLRGGFYQNAPNVHEMVARHYGRPSIHMGVELVKMIDAGKAVFVPTKGNAAADEGKIVFSDDNTHPTIPAGHKVYADAVLRGIEAMMEVGQAGPVAPGAPLRADHWQKAKTLPADGRMVFSGNWEKLTADKGPSCFRFGKKQYEWFPFLYRTEETGATATLRFKGIWAGIKGMQGPDGASVAVSLDGKPLRKDLQFTAYHGRSFYAGGPEGPFTDGPHTLAWTLTDEAVDKRAILKSYYRAGNDKPMDEHPDWFTPKRFTVGEIMLIGDLVDEKGNVVP